MSPSATTTPAPPPDAPTDPSVAKTSTGAYPLEANDLSSLIKYHHHPAGLSIVSLVSRPAGAVLTPITTSTPTHIKRWSSVQTGRDTHIELNSALLYMNHSCAPSLEIDTQNMQVRVAAGRDLKEGDDLTFFYPSTEWEFDNPFHCLCGADACLGNVRGAKYLSAQEVETRWANEHIKDLVRERDA